jgi:hypothetical protein
MPSGSGQDREHRDSAEVQQQESFGVGKLHAGNAAVPGTRDGNGRVGPSSLACSSLVCERPPDVCE